MVNVALALLATLAAFGGAGLLVSRTLPDRHTYLIAWCATLFALGITLGAMMIGFAAGFGPALLRVMELFGSLIAPLTLALGVVELVARTVQARFAARLIAASYVIVAVVIILLDPIIGTFGKSLPKVSGHYSSLPSMVLAGAHVFAVVSLVSCVAVTAVRGNRRDREAAELMMPLALIALAGVLVVAAMRSLLPGVLVPIILAGAAALVWFGATRLLLDRDHADDDEEEPEYYDDMRQYPQQPQQPRYDNGPDGGRRPAQPSFAPAPMPPMPGMPSPGQYGRITVYTLIEGHGEVFDRLAAEVTRAVRNEPGTVVYACHSVDNAPDQRLFYQLFRDANAVEAHTRQPYVQHFAREARAHVEGTNVIELTVGVAKVAGPPEGPGRPEGPGMRPERPGPRPEGPGPRPENLGPRPEGPGQRPDGRTGPHAVRWPNG